MKSSPTLVSFRVTIVIVNWNSPYIVCHNNIIIGNVKIIFTISSLDLPTFRIVGDNCDLHQKPSHLTLSRRDQDHHWFNIYAVQDCVLGLHLPDDQSTASIATLPVAAFLPNVEDCVALRKEFIILTARVLIRYIPWFEFLKSAVPEHITHQYTQAMAQKSEIVCYETVIITCYLHKYNCSFSTGAIGCAYEV